MLSLILLLAVTALYAGYNLLIKVSSAHVPAEVTSTILATISLQVAALGASALFAAILLLRGGHTVQLTVPAYAWAAAAGLCIGGAEIAYFYLFGGIGHGRPMPASIAIPVIVSGTIVITAVVAHFIFREPLSTLQLLGGALVIGGIVLMYLGKAAPGMVEG
ncbi:MAG: hypothetical protein ACYSTL_06595 [Planctomycetota bacterium]|jgi:drug/metabolite transporter (DMT)-like permease